MVDTGTFLRHSVTALDQAQSASSRVINRMVADLNAAAAAADRRMAADPTAAATLRQQALTRATGIVTTAAGAVQQTIDTYDHALTGYAGELTARGYAPVVPPSPRQGHTTPRQQKHWWESALDTAGDIGAAVHNHTVVPAVNAAADLGQAAMEHPADLA